MKIQSVKNNSHNQNFKGYDARELKGFLMCTNYDNIANEMRNIGQKEGFDVFYFNREKNNSYITTDKAPLSENHKGGWAQDRWGIIKDKLLMIEDEFLSSIVKKNFNLTNNPIQDSERNRIGVPYALAMFDSLNKAQKITVSGEEFLLVHNPLENDFVTLSKKIVDTELIKAEIAYKNDVEMTHIEGGNYFIVKGQYDKDELIIGSDELKKFSIDQIKKMFNVVKVHVLPQCDFHIDLFMRPLDQKTILLADDDLMLETLKEGLDAVNKSINNSNQNIELKNKLEKVKENLNNKIEKFEDFSKLNPLPKTKFVEKILKKSGFEVIKVPARLYEPSIEKRKGQPIVLLTQHHNYINANALINKDGDLVYITNKSLLDKQIGITPEIESIIGFSLQKKFISSIDNIVDPEKIYFVSGDNNTLSEKIMKEFRGGIHCLCAEVPEDNSTL